MLQNLLRKPLLPFIALGLALWVFVVYKALAVPFTCDEGNTILFYAKMSIHDIVTYKDPVPNNHIVNTLLIKFFVGLFGLHQFSPRLPSMLGFALYFVAATAFARKMTENNWLAFAIVVCFVLNPYLLDFYSVARGYSLANALLLAGLYYAFCWVKDADFSTKNLLISLVLLILAAYTNFGLLLCFCGANLAFFFWGLASRRPLKELAIQVACQGAATVLLGAMSYLPVKRMSETDQFRFWGKTSFYTDTIDSLLNCILFNCKYWGSNTNKIITGLGIAFFVAIVSIVSWNYRKLNIKNTAPLFFIGVFLATILANVLQHRILGTPYATTRTALFYFPLFVSALVWILVLVYQYQQRAGYGLAFLFTLGACWNFFHNANITYIEEWWYDSHTYQLMSYLEDTYKKENRTTPFRVAFNGIQMPSALLFHEINHPKYIEYPQFKNSIDAQSDADFYYCMDEQVQSLSEHFTVVVHYDGGQSLLRRK